MSLRDVPQERLTPGVTRLRHVELGTDLVYEGSVDGYILVRDVAGGEASACHIDDAEMVEVSR